MSLKCILGFHSWAGCKCTVCGKTRNKLHNWTSDSDKCSKCGKEQNYIIDERDGNKYKIIKIGNQIIMAENLRFKHHRDCRAYNNKTKNAKKYGYLYSWYAAKAKSTVEGLNGWHLPTKKEWETLYEYLGGDAQKVYNALKKGGNSGFNALLCGFGKSGDYAYIDRNGNGMKYESFGNLGEFTKFWSATEVDREITNFVYFFGCSSERAWVGSYVPTDLCSVRLFKD